MIYLILSLMTIMAWIYFVGKARKKARLTESSQESLFWVGYQSFMLTSIVCFGLSVLIGSVLFLGSIKRVYRSSEKTVSLVALKDMVSHENNLSSGYFIGIIPDNMNDVYKIKYAASNYGNIQVKTLKADEHNVVFVEDGMNKLVVNMSYDDIVFTEAGKLLFFRDDPNMDAGCPAPQTTYTFHIPKGSILNEYSVDME